MLKPACSPATPCAPRGSIPPFLGNHPRRTRVDYLDNAEPNLSELLDDEIVRRLMAKDGVEPDMVWALAARLQGVPA